MIETLAIRNYRSILNLKMPLGRLNIVTGANGSGKSNLYRSLRLLAETGLGGVVNALAAEGGLQSTFWAGPETISRDMKQGVHPVQGGANKNVKRLCLGFKTAEFGYLIELGLPEPTRSAFSRDPQIKRECLWAGPVCRPASLLVDRKGPAVRARSLKQEGGRKRGDWRILSKHVPEYASIFTEVADFSAAPELMVMREQIRQWRFYDHFRGDAHSPARIPQLATRTPVMHHDGRDIAAALQTIREVGDAKALDKAIEDAFPGTRLSIKLFADTRLSIQLQQPGMLRTLGGSELSDGTLRFLLWIAALLTPRPPPMMVLNEPETSLHPDLLPALARLIVRASEDCQVWVVTHSNRLVNALEESADCSHLQLLKELGETRLAGQRMLDEPPWHWAG